MRSKQFFILVFLAAAEMGAAAQDKTPNAWKPFDYTEHLKTMYDGADLKYAFEKYKPSQWKKWQKELRRELTLALGLDIIERNCKGFVPEARQLDSEDLGEYTRERWEIITEPDVLLPMVVMRPKNLNGPVPLMITPHGHYKNTEVYAGVYADEKEKARIQETECDFAVQAVQHGFIAIAPTSRGFGKTRTKNDIANDAIYSCPDLMLRDALVGRTPIGDRVWDMMRILDWALQSLSIDRKNVIVCGNSGGGTVALYTGALDTRFSQSVPADYLCGFVESLGLIRHCACNYVPGVMRLCEMGEIAALTAPRPFCAINGAQDEIFPIEGTRRVFSTVKKVYQAAGVPDNCMLYAGPGGHRFFKEPAWNFILSHINR